MDVRVCAFRCCRACALSQIVADRAGNIFNKDALIMYTLHKAERTIPAFSHIRSLKQVLAECVWSAREVDALAVRTQGLFCLQRASGVAGVAPVSMHVPSGAGRVASENQARAFSRPLSHYRCRFFHCSVDNVVAGGTCGCVNVGSP